MRKVANALTLLERTGQAGNTIVVITSDHGMPFPRAKASLYDYGSRVPLAIRWPSSVPGRRTVDDSASLSDLAPTFLEAAGLVPPADMTARSLLPILTSAASGPVEMAVSVSESTSRPSSHAPTTMSVTGLIFGMNRVSYHVLPLDLTRMNRVIIPAMKGMPGMRQAVYHLRTRRRAADHGRQARRAP